MTERVECVVAGAGVIGLATARALALAGREVLVLEAEDTFGTQISSRNSEVVHAGIYYPGNSLKAKLCVAGNRSLYAYCDTRGVEYQKTGKLIVATSEGQVDVLRSYLERGQANGAADLELISGEKLRQLEPDVRGVAALWSPSTGIVDSHGLMLALLGDLENAGGTLVPQSRVNRFRAVPDGIEIDVGTGDTAMQLQTRWLVNAAGHGALGLARASGMENLPEGYFPAGHYFGYQGKSPFSHLVYPVATPGSLGIHATLDLGGQLKFGPDVDWRDRLDYSFDASEARRLHFENSVRDYYPDLDAGRLQPGYVGVRQRISAPGEPLKDFQIAGPEQHGISGLVQLFGIESPGLTACLAIAGEVVSRLHPA